MIVYWTGPSSPKTNILWTKRVYVYPYPSDEKATRHNAPRLPIELFWIDLAVQ